MEENAIRGRASGGRNFFVRMGSSEIRERKESRERYTGPRVRNRNCQSLTFVAEIARPRCREANFKERNSKDEESDSCTNRGRNSNKKLWN